MNVSSPAFYLRTPASRDIYNRMNTCPAKRTGGFTLIELLIVVVIIGILASVALLKYQGIKEKAYLASMKSDLHNTITAQETYFSDNLNYFNGALPDGTFDFRPSAGVTILLANVSMTGWQATASHTATPKVCAVFLGDAPAAPPATEAGAPACTP